MLDSAKEQRPDRAQRGGDRPQDPSRPDRRGNPSAPDQQQAQERAAPPPRNDADAQANDRVTREDRERWRNQRRELVEERGQRIDGRPDFERPRGWDVLGPIGDALLGQNQNQDRNRDRGRDRNWDQDRDDGRVIISIDNQTYVRHDDSRRFYDDGGRPEYERLSDGRYREVVERNDGTRVVTIRNRYGEVVQRSRIVRGGREYVLYYAPELLEDRQDYTWRDPGDELPPMRLGVPIDDYIIDTSSQPDRDYYRFLEQPPVERVERPYSLDEVRYSARIRDKVPRIDLDTITFATGSAEIPMNQATSLRKVADAINKVLEKDPSETFLIEGHTDAVGSDESNLVLSDKRAESVAVVLSDAFGIPPENMTTQGYGERYLKVSTEAANQENRRVTIRRITPLVKPVASNQ
ncbi:OmpA family protein [Agrobacterium sp. Ap1]|uniref:OmpA family protein n=1 Tax=Agrobacterium sp. Ap1 TaxID=2815337 RepID=UPI00336C2193